MGHISVNFAYLELISAHFKLDRKLLSLLCKILCIWSAPAWFNVRGISFVHFLKSLSWFSIQFFYIFQRLYFFFSSTKIEAVCGNVQSKQTNMLFFHNEILLMENSCFQALTKNVSELKTRVFINRKHVFSLTEITCFHRKHVFTFFRTVWPLICLFTDPSYFVPCQPAYQLNTVRTRS